MAERKRSVHLAIHADPELAALVARMADEHDLSISAYATWAIRQQIESDLAVGQQHGEAAA
jgi:hypothetical protein